MSADLIDTACELEQLERDLAIKAAREKAAPDTTYHTHCSWCGDASEDGKRFCSYGVDSCATDANRHQTILQRTGALPR